MSESEQLNLSQNINPESESDQPMQDQSIDKDLKNENNSESDIVMIPQDQQSDECNPIIKEPIFKK